jgi:hypothetical protein
VTVLVDPPTPEARPKKDPKAEKWITGNGRYALPDPDTGQARTWTRVTTLAKTLEDTYNLQKWDGRMVARGVALRPDLAALAQGADPDDEEGKRTLNRVAAQAKEVAGASRGANLGTALHRLTELSDAGREVQAGSLAGELDAYRATMAARGWRVVPEYLERIICVPELGVAGRLDKLVAVRGRGRLMVADLKSQKSMDWGGLAIAIQLSIYAHAYAMWNEETERWESPPVMNQDEAVVLWAPIGRNLCEPYRVDLLEGWHWAQASLQVREARKAKLVTPWTVDRIAAPDPPAARVVQPEPETVWDIPAVDMSQVRAQYWAQVFAEAVSVDALMALVNAAVAEYGGPLPEPVKLAGRERRAVLQAATQTP